MVSSVGKMVGMNIFKCLEKLLHMKRLLVSVSISLFQTASWYNVVCAAKHPTSKTQIFGRRAGF